MSRLSDVTNAAIRNILGNRCLSKNTLAINAGSAATVKTTGTLDFCVNGVAYSKAALSAQTIVPSGKMYNWQGQAVSAFYVQPISTTVFYTIGLDAAGNVYVVQGNYAGQKLSNDPAVGIGNSMAGATWVGDGSIPDVPADVTPIGAIKVVTGSAAFTPGTTALDAANITFTFYDFSSMPAGTL